MIRRAAITATVTLGLMLTAAHTVPVYGRLVTSAQKFQRSFRDLGGAGNSLSPIERFFFSLALAGTRTPEKPAAAATPPQHS